MKKYLLFIGFLLTSFVSFSQVIPKPNPTAVGIGYKRLLADSTIFIPTGGAIPRLGSNNINRRSAIYADTINKKLWVFYPNDSTWKESGLTKINWDSVFNKPIYFKTKYDSSTDIKDSILARLAIRDTAAMLAPYARTGTLTDYVPNTRSLTINGVAQNLSTDRTWSIAPGGLSGQILSKNSNTDYDYGWIDNFADWTSTIKEYVKAGQDITKGQAVYVSSSDGTNIIVSKASNATEATSSKVIGLLAQTLSTNGKGYVITEGLLSGLNTASATTGDPVWLGVDGNLIYGLTNKPYAPAHLVYIGVVVRSNSSNGEIFIQPQNGFELRELHDVSAQSPSNNEGLFYNSSNSLWQTKSIATVLGYTPANAATYVPYTGATSSVNLGTNALNAGAITSEAGYAFKILSAGTLFQNGYSVLSSLAGNVSITQAISAGNLKAFTFDFSAWATNTTRNYTMPDASGTLALTSDLGNYVTLNTFQTITANKAFSGWIKTDDGIFLSNSAAVSSSTGFGKLSYNKSGVVSTFRITNENNATASLAFDNTTNYSYNFPTVSGTVALLEGTQTFSGTKNFSNPAYAEKGVVLLTGSTSFAAGQTTLNGNANGLTIGLGVTVGSTTTSYAHQLLFPQLTPRTYTYPAASGTIALTSDLGAYVPYTGATGTVNIGIYTLNAGNIDANGISTSGGAIRLKQNGIINTGPVGYTTLSSAGAGLLDIYFGDTNLYSVELTNNLLTANRVYNFPNASGTVALTSDFSSYLPLSGGILTGKLAGLNLEFSSPSATFVSGGVNNSISTQTIAVPNGSTWSNGSVFSASNNTQFLNFAGSQSIQNGSVVAGTVNVNRIAFTAGSSTVTLAQSTGIRAMAGMQMLQQTGGTINGTVSHGASMFVQGVYPTNTANVTFSNYYGLLMNPLDEWGGVTFTNRWGIYQSGASDKNYFNGNLLIKTTTDNGSALQVTGAATFSSSVTLNNLFTPEKISAIYGVNQATSSGNGGNLTVKAGGGFGAGNTGGNLYLGFGRGNSSANNGSMFFGVAQPTNIEGLAATYMTILDGGNVGIGTSSPGYLMTLYASTEPILVFQNAGAVRASIYSNSGELAFNSLTTNPINWYINGVPKMQLTGGGNLLVGTTTDVGASFKLQVAGDGYFTKVTPSIRLNGTPFGNSGANIQLLGWASGNYNWQISTAMFSGGLELSASSTTGGSTFSTAIGLFSPSTGIYTPLSDVNKKKDFEASNIGLKEVLQLKPTLYRMKTEDANSPKTLGFIAQEVKQIIPQAYVENGDFIGVSDRPIIAALVKAVQELQQQITDLKTQINKK